jgi:hypothetical protein
MVNGGWWMVDGGWWMVENGKSETCKKNRWFNWRYFAMGEPVSWKRHRFRDLLSVAIRFTGSQNTS